MSDPWYTINDLDVRVTAVPKHFDYNDPVTRQQLIGDGSADVGNEVLQSGALGFREAQYQLVLLDFADVELLQAYKATSEEVVWTTRFGTTHTCVVTGVTVSESVRDLFPVTLTLVEVDAGASS